MNRIGVLLIVYLFLAGCVGAGMAPSREDVARFRRAQIVAMETHPLGIPPAFTGALVPGPLGPFAGVANVVGTIVTMPAASKMTGEQSKALQANLEAKDAWAPTVVLANEVQSQLAAAGIDAAVAPGVKPIPGIENRDYTVLMENWLAPIRAWYNDTGPISDYTGTQSTQFTYVLEVGLLNYEITGDNLLVQVVIKLIDPSNGTVIGRARANDAWSMPTVRPLDQAFAGNGKIFKQIFAAEGRKLVGECLTDLGLIR